MPFERTTQFLSRRHLPHLQAVGKTLFVTYTTEKRRVLPSLARDLALVHCVAQHGKRIYLHAAVIIARSHPPCFRCT